MSSLFFMNQFKDALRIYSLQIALLASFTWLPFIEQVGSYALGALCIVLPSALVFILHAVLHAYQQKSTTINTGHAKVYGILFIGVHVTKYVLILALIAIVFLLLPKLQQANLISFALNVNNGAYGVIASGISYILATFWVGLTAKT